MAAHMLSRPQAVDDDAIRFTDFGGKFTYLIQRLSHRTAT